HGCKPWSRTRRIRIGGLLGWTTGCVVSIYCATDILVLRSCHSRLWDSFITLGEARRNQVETHSESQSRGSGARFELGLRNNLIISKLLISSTPHPSDPCRNTTINA